MTVSVAMPASPLLPAPCPPGQGVALSVSSPRLPTVSGSQRLPPANAAWPRQPGMRPMNLTTSWTESVPSGYVRLSLLGVSGVFNARAVMLGVPFLWGSFAPAGKLLYRLPWAVDPVLFNALRLLVASLCVLPVMLRDLRARNADRRSLVGAGAELGFWSFLCSTFQVVGLRHTTASKAAFINQLYTVLVPIFALVAGVSGAYSWHVWAGAALALSGVAILTLDNAHASFTAAGDGLMLACAVADAIFILRTRAVAARLRPAPLVAYKVAFQCLFAFAYAFMCGIYSNGLQSMSHFSKSRISASFASATPSMLVVNLALVVWAGVFISSMATWLHVRAGAVVSAAETAVIFSFTPLVTAFLSIFLGEHFGLQVVLGGALIVFSAILSSRAPPPKVDSGKSASLLVS